MKKENKKGYAKFNKAILSLQGLIIFIALALNSYSMTCGFQTPANNGYLTYSDILNVSFEPNPAANTDNEPKIRVAFFLTSSSTANNTVAAGLIKNQSNSTDSMAPLSVNITFGNNTGTNNTVLEEGIYVAD